MCPVATARRSAIGLLSRQLEQSAVYPGAGGRMANSWDESAVQALSRLAVVNRAFGLGSVLAVEMKDSRPGYERVFVFISRLPCAELLRVGKGRARGGGGGRIDAYTFFLPAPISAACLRGVWL